MMRPRLFFLVGLLAVGAGCEHDPTVLETHPLDLRGATTYAFQSFYLEMSDGVRIATDVYVPEDYPAGGPFPTILEMTRYWRSRSDEAPYYVRRALQRGFAYVVVDERGTGASFGSWPAPLTDRALSDGWEVLDWITDQPWSNGRVGSTGISYPGMASHQLAATGHPALQAIVPLSDTYDLYGDLIFPGGLFNEAFLQGWRDITYALDRNRTVSVGGESFRLAPVQDDPEGALLDEALAGHQGNLDAFQAFQGITFRDDPSPSGFTLDDLSTRAKAALLDDAGVPIYQWGSWMDAGSADGVIRAFMTSTGPRRAVIGSWTHDLSRSAYTGDSNRWTAKPAFEVQWEEALNFFEDRLRKDKPIGERVLRYYTMGEGLWKATDTWPPVGTVLDTLYLAEGGALSPEAPTDSEGDDLYQVDFGTQSALEPRWLGPLFANAWYPDRRTRDLELLVYETAPLARNMEVTGYPVVHLNLTSTREDGAFFVYLESVSPENAVTYVTEGLLRGIHRKVVEEPSPWQRPIPFHSFLAADAEPMVPGQVTRLAIGMEPTSFLFRKGHRIRIAIAGHDRTAFRRVPASGTPTLRIQRNADYPSWIELPVVPRSSQ